MTGEKYPVLILAGGPTPEKILAEGEKEKERAFIDIGGRPMLQFVLDAVDKSGIASDLLVMGNSERMKSTFGLKPEQVSDDRNSMLENFMFGLERFKDRPLVVSTTCDAPLLTGESLRFIADTVAKMDAEVYWTIVDVKEFDKELPGGKRTTQKLKEGTYTGGNVFVLNPKKVLANREKIEAVIRDRKSPAKLIRLFGLPFIVKFALKQLDMKGLEEKATKILGAKMRAVVTPYAGVGFDVDKPIDLVMAREKIGHA